MNQRVAVSAALSLSFSMLVACGVAIEESKGETIYLVDGETALVHVSGVGCGEAGPQVTVRGEVNSKGDPGFVDIQLELDGKIVGQIQALSPEDFGLEEDAIGATLEALIPLPAGEHSFRLCLVELDVKGVIEGRACLPLRQYSRECDLTETDHTLPTISSARRREANENGWYREPVTVQFYCSDAGSGIATCTESITLSEEGLDLVAKGEAVDLAGNRATVTDPDVRIDWTPPVISFVGARDYLVDEIVEAGCNSVDELSGIHDSSCTGNWGEAYMFDVGTYPIQAYAVDLAGNEASANAEFSVSATASSVCNIVKRFVRSGDRQASLCAKLLSAEKVFSAGDVEGGNAELAAFHKEIDEETDQSVSADRAGTLLRLSVGLRP